MNKIALKSLIFSIFLLNYYFLIGDDNSLKCDGKIEFKNGVKIIKNSQKPLFQKFNFDLKEDLCISYGKNKNDYFEWISKVELDNESNIYLLDSNKCVIHKFNSQGFHLFTFGRKGTGPGEFQRPIDFFINKKGIIYVLDNRIIHVFDKKGNYKDQIKLNKNATDFFVNSNGEGIISYISYSPKIKEILVILLNHDFNIKKEIVRLFDGLQVRRELNGKKMSFFVENIYTPQLCFQRTFNERCIFAYSTDYTLNIINSKGDYILKIKKEENRQKITEKEKNIIYEWYAPYYEKKWTKKILKEALQFPDYRPFFNNILVDEIGRIYVARLESVLLKENKINNNVVFDIFNKEGYYLYQITIPFLPEIIKSGYLYKIDESDDSEDIKIKRFKIKNWIQMRNKI